MSVVHPGDRGPRRLQLGRDTNGRTMVPTGAVRVDRASPWWPPFDLDHPYIARRRGAWVDDRAHRLWLLASMYRAWITGTLVENSMWWLLTPESARRAVYLPPAVAEIQHVLKGKALADWPPIGCPCIGDVLLSIANQSRDGVLFSTASDNFKPKQRPQTAGQRERTRRQNSYVSTVFGR